MQLILVLILIFLKQNIFLQMFQYFLLTISLSGVWMERQLCKNIILMCQSWRDSQLCTEDKIQIVNHEIRFIFP